MPWSGVRDHIDVADCFVFSSLREHSSAQCLEAAARGVPIVALDQDGICDVLPAVAVAKARTDTDDLAGALAEAMVAAVSDPLRWARASRAALDWAAQNTWDRKVATAELADREVVG